MKRLSLVTNPEADRVENLEGNSKTTAKGDGRCGRHGQKRKRHGTWEIHRRLAWKPSMSTEWTNLRETEATVEVGLAGSVR